ncbi:hypothetical protein CDD83_6574 [Cordyceps sp. RAO-2017]|nr:hypothetical protein CDD83_6574 [Cordyceps sp. RAO-2017]
MPVSSLSELDAHEQPSEAMRAEWKLFSRMEPQAVLQDGRVDDPRLGPRDGGFRAAGAIPEAQVARALAQLGPECTAGRGDAAVLSHPLLPGLLVLPDLVPPAAQAVLLDKMLHRDLSDPRHQTNMHLHYELPYPRDEHDGGGDDDGPGRKRQGGGGDGRDASSATERSFFSLPPDAPALFRPKEPAVHKPLSARQALHRRLHWLTLGGQYDWTRRLYPDAAPPAFPPDLAAFLEALFPDTLAQAAIVNLYSPGDTMMLHRDVSERADRGLVSLSLGCDGLFMIAPGAAAHDDGDDGDSRGYLLLRLRSGDAIYMAGESRYAWHGVPKVLGDTCPGHLERWPARDDGRFGPWDGWMKNKRINLNVRQMKD